MSIKAKLLFSLFMLHASFYAQAEQLEFEQVLQKVIDHYPSVNSAALQLEKAKQENVKAESQLSWQLNGNTGFTRSTSLFGTADDRLNVGASLNRSLSNGGELGFSADVIRDNAEISLLPSIPNPVTKTQLEVSYRHHLQKGADNTQYTESKTAAMAGVKIAQGEKTVLYDELAAQTIELYLAAATTQARVKNTQKTIDRSLRLKDYISKEFKLGLSEVKDVLQVDARLATNRADKQSLDVLWQKQVISLNRLMNHSWQSKFSPQLKLVNDKNRKFDFVYAQAEKQNAVLKQIDARLQLADSAIRLSRDKRQDELDLVMYLGNESNQGDTANGNFNESQVVGGISLEFRRGLDKSGLNAELRQAHYDRELALQDKKLIQQNLYYDVASLLAEVESAELAVTAFKKSVNAEQQKLTEATKRYKDGRIETDRIIDFESQLANAELSYELQKVELARRYYQLDLLRGAIWQTVVRHEISFAEEIEQGIN